MQKKITHKLQKNTSSEKTHVSCDVKKQLLTVIIKGL